MCDNSIANMEIEEIDKEIKNFTEICIQFSNRNVKQPKPQSLNYLEIGVYTEIPKDILSSLCKIIQSFVQICATHTEFKLHKKESEFLSGVKCINNIIKHEYKNFNITDIIYPDFKCETSNNDFLEGKIPYLSLNDVSFRLSAVWVDIKGEISNRSHKNQLSNYKKYLQNEDVIDTVIIMKRIIDKHKLQLNKR